MAVRAETFRKIDVIIFIIQNSNYRSDFFQGKIRAMARFHKKSDREDIDASGLAKTIASEPRDKGLKNIPVTPGNYGKFRGNGDRPLPKGIVIAVVGLMVFFAVGSVASYYVVKERIVREITARENTIAQGVNDLQNFDPQSAEQQFSSLENPSDLGGLVNAFGFLFRGSISAFQSFTDISSRLSAFSADVITLKHDAFTFASTGNGADMIASLTSVNGDLAAIDADSNALGIALPSASSSYGASGLTDAYLPLKSQVESTHRFLNEFIPWFATSTPHHVLVMLQNPSEEKPAGGFLGSYADITIASGSIVAIDVRDVADVDRAFTQNIIPPVPLQLETNRFRPADANWFFDFPTSASETINFFEQSELYAASGTTFDAAIAVSPKVVSDLLMLTGPIAAGKPTTTFTSSNLVPQIQKLVQAGQASGATYPKAILRSLASGILARLETVTSTAVASAATTTPDLSAMVPDWIAKKDVMAYFKDPIFENFGEQYGVAGDVYALPQKFNGDYLAVVNADINADKSEWYVAQTVNFDAQIGSDGVVSDHVIIDRKHNGNTSSYSWYRTTNQDYLQVFVSPGSTVLNENGGVVRKVPAPLNYAKAGYSTDPMVVSIETSTLQLFAFPAVTTGEQFGKDVFGVWSRVQAGKTTELTFDYSHHLFTVPAPGVQYQFVFEKQAGARGDYQFEIDAPLGYVFKENDLPAYTYESNDPPGRFVVILTLQKL